MVGIVAVRTRREAIGEAVAVQAYGCTVIHVVAATRARDTGVSVSV